jgi:hypothetical protein
MTTEIRTNANAAVVSLITAAIPGAEWVRVGKKNMLVVPSGIKDENGVMVYVTIETTAKSTTPTATAAAFDVEAAKEEYAAWVATAAEKASAPKAPKVTDEEKAAKAAKKEAQVKAICAWALEEMEDGKEYTTTEIKEAIAGFEDVSILSLGTLMKDVVSTELVNVEAKNGKKYYTKA